MTNSKVGSWRPSWQRQESHIWIIKFALTAEVQVVTAKSLLERYWWVNNVDLNRNGYLYRGDCWNHKDRGAILDI